MYLVVTETPVFVAGGQVWVGAGRRRALVLLRESLEERLGPVTLLAPTLPLLEAGDAPPGLEQLGREDGVRVVASVDLRGAPRAYWLRERSRWRADLRAWTARARMVQAELTDLVRPLAFEGFREARRQGCPTVFVLAHDAVRERGDGARAGGPLARARAQVFGVVFDGAARYAARTADLTLLRAGAPMRRYAPHAHNPRAFHETSFRSREIVAAAAVEERLRGRGLGAGQPLRVACVGRLDARRHGVDHAIDAVRLGRQRGTPLVLDVIGEGDDRQRLESRIASLGLRPIVRFVGGLQHGPERYRRLAGYDALVFTPAADASPRAIFDGFAAGVPTVGYGTEDLRQRAEEDGAAVPVRPGDIDAVAHALCELSRDRERLAQLSRAAHRAARFHAADAWARRRAAWALEALETRGLAGRADRRLAA